MSDPIDNVLRVLSDIVLVLIVLLSIAFFVSLCCEALA